MILILAATLLVAVPLTISTTQAVRGALENHIALDVVVFWLQGSASELEKVAVVEDEVDVYIMGAPGTLLVQVLADSLADALGRPIVVSLRQIPSDVVRTASSRSPLSQPVDDPGSSQIGNKNVPGTCKRTIGSPVPGTWSARVAASLYFIATCAMPLLRKLNHSMGKMPSRTVKTSATYMPNVAGPERTGVVTVSSVGSPKYMLTVMRR